MRQTNKRLGDQKGKPRLSPHDKRDHKVLLDLAKSKKQNFLRHIAEAKMKGFPKDHGSFIQTPSEYVKKHDPNWDYRRYRFTIKTMRLYLAYYGYHISRAIVIYILKVSNLWDDPNHVYFRGKQKIRHYTIHAFDVVMYYCIIHSFVRDVSITVSLLFDSNLQEMRMLRAILQGRIRSFQHLLTAVCQQIETIEKKYGIEPEEDEDFFRV